MTRNPVLAAVSAVALLLLTAASALYGVNQSQQALVLRFGRPVRLVNASGDGAGLYVRWPFVDRVVRLDRRTLSLEDEPTDTTIAGGERLSLRAAMSYRIADPLRLYRSLGDGHDALDRLRSLLQASVARALASSRRQDIVADRRAVLMQAALNAMRRSAEPLGVEVVDVALLDAEPTPAQAEAAARRMQDQETQQAAHVRSEGDAHKQDLIARADREAADIRGEGEREALELRGDGDAQRTAILGAAYGADPDFARFFRRLEAYDQALNPLNTTLILSPDNAFLDLFSHGPTAQARPH